MFVDYGQWARQPEYRASQKVVSWARRSWSSKLEPLRYISIEFLKAPVGSAWGRGIALVGIAAMWAYTHGDNWGGIALGNHKGDVGPDCKPGDFDTYLNLALQEATRGALDLVLPIKDLSIEEIGVKLEEYKAPFDLMYSCYWYPPCGYKSRNEEYRCPGCRRKEIAMRAAGKDPMGKINFTEHTYQSPLAEEVPY
jgi:7-cyano-7-deazaguanine synthase in queuosine biosynthesis